MHPSLPSTDEDARLRALSSYAVLNTSSELAFDQIVQLAADIFDVPIALVSLVDRDRQYFKAKVGLDACQTGRDVSFCDHAIRQDVPLVVLDATRDPRFCNNSLVTAEPHIRFYAGAPLIAKNGHRLGTLCIIDQQPRTAFSDKQRGMLRDLAAMVMQVMELRRAKLEAKERRDQLLNIAASAPDAIITANANNVIGFWNAGAEAIFGFSAAEAIGQPLTIIMPPSMRVAHSAGLTRVAAGGVPRLINRTVDLVARHKGGREFPIELSLSRWSEHGEPQFGAIIRDVSQRKQAEERLRYAAEHDALTGLLNRASLTHAIAERQQQNIGLTLLLIDLDGFKSVNDTHGHPSGDRVLQIIAERMQGIVARDHLLARLGGDEFVVLIAGSSDPLQASALGGALIACIEEPLEWNDYLIHLSASVGVALADGEGITAKRLLGDADLALYKAKTDGRGRVRLFTPELRQQAVARGSVSFELHEAWDDRDFELYYQPQIRLSDGALVGAEALIRWNRPYQGVVLPGAFLPALETSRLAAPVGEWILRTACQQAALWRQMGAPHLRMGVNLFAAQMRTRSFVEDVERALMDHDLPPEALELEITENIVLRNETQVSDQLTALRALGVGIAFDDFGTGYASLTMLKQLDITRLKIDRSFVRDIEKDRMDQAIVDAITRMAEGADLAVIAEGIETSAQLHHLRGRVAEGQGYLFGKPMRSSDFAERFLPAKLVVAGVA